MIILGQRQKEWATTKLGNSSLTIGRVGCTTCGLSMLSDYYGQFLTPNQIATSFKNYTNDGLIIWQNLDFDKFKFVERVRKFDPVKIEDAMKDPNKSVLLNIWNNSHWVVGIRGSVFGGYIVADPWPLPNGQKKRIKSSDISGFAIFTKK